MDLRERKEWMRRKSELGKMEYLITAGLIIVLFLLACAYRKITPFGTNLLVNESDFKTQSVPIYMHLWDALHGRADLFFDWRFGLGSNFSGTLSHYSLISPFSLFFLFISRESIPSMMTWFILLKLIAMGLTMCCFLRNDRLLFSGRLSSGWIIAGAAGYALSGYTAQYYGFPWMDTAVFVPLLFLNLNRVLEKKSPAFGIHEIGYTLFLALIAIINIPQAFAVCLGVMGYACGALFLKETDRSVRRTAAGKLICCSLLGLGISMVIFLPAYLNISHSYRMTYGNYGNGIASYIAKMNLAKQETYRKYRIVLGSLIPLAGGLLSLGAAEKRNRRFCLYLLFLALTPVVFESVNGIYHNGPYSCYPMRYGFLTVFLMTAAGLALLNGNPLFQKAAVSVVLMIGWCCLSLGLYLKDIEAEPAYDYESLRQSCLNTDDAEGSDVFRRYKQADAAMMENYPLYADLPALSNYVPLNSLRQVNFVRGLGYAQNWVALDDAGGTVFTDLLLGVQTVITDAHYVQEFTQLTEGSGLYADPKPCGANQYAFDLLAHYELPLFVKDPEALAQIDPDLDPFSQMNRISRQLWNTPLFETEAVSLNAEAVSFSHAFDETHLLYIWIPTGIHEFSVNGTKRTVPVYGYPDNTGYPRDTNNGTFLLGTFSEETAEVTITGDVGGEAVFGWISTEALLQTTRQTAITDIRTKTTGSSVAINLVSEEDGYVILPVYADEGWQYQVNGVKQEPQLLGSALPVLPVQAGENQLAMSFRPEGLTAGTIITIGSLLVLVVIGYCARRMKPESQLFSAAELTVKAVWVLYLLYVYIIPILFRIGMSLYKRLF